MKKSTYLLIENYMISYMKDSAHDKEHIYRVLFNAMEIAKHEKDVNYDILICSCLLHDIGRSDQFENPNLSREFSNGLPEKMKPFWEPNMYAWHSAEWWQNLWQNFSLLWVFLPFGTQIKFKMTTYNHILFG